MPNPNCHYNFYKRRIVYTISLSLFHSLSLFLSLSQTHIYTYIYTHIYTNLYIRIINTQNTTTIFYITPLILLILFFIIHHKYQYHPGINTKLFYVYDFGVKQFRTGSNGLFCFHPEQEYAYHSIPDAAMSIISTSRNESQSHNGSSRVESVPYLSSFVRQEVSLKSQHITSCCHESHSQIHEPNPIQYVPRSWIVTQ